MTGCSLTTENSFVGEAPGLPEGHSPAIPIFPMSCSSAPTRGAALFYVLRVEPHRSGGCTGEIADALAVAGSIAIACVESVGERADELDVGVVQALARFEDRDGGVVVILDQLTNLKDGREGVFELGQYAGACALAKMRDHGSDWLFDGA